MTAPIVIADSAVEQIPLEKLDANLKNPRRTMDEVGLQELAGSIREHGINVPLIVRPLRRVCVEFEDGHEEETPFQSPQLCAELLSEPGKVRTEIEDRFEIICGHRRSEAATLAGLDSVPCIVRVMDDAEAAEIAFIDNAQRVDVPVIEEADALGELLDRLHSIAAVAAKVGKEQSYIAKRLKLRTLSPWSRDALREQLITVDHALLLARLAEIEQNDALKWCLDHSAGIKMPVDKVIQQRMKLRQEHRSHWMWEPQSVQRLKEHIESNSGVALDRAPWPMEEDYLLPDAGSCLDCEKNTKANAPLFGDLDIGAATCTDGACFKAKVVSLVNIEARQVAKEAAMKAGQPPVPGAFEPLRVSWKATSTEPRKTTVKTDAPGQPAKGSIVVNLAQIFKAGQWIEATKACEYARAAVAVDWSDAGDRGYMGSAQKLRKPGEVVLVCVTPKCKTHPKAYERQASGAPGLRNQNSDAERQRREEKETAFKLSEPPVRRAIYDAIVQKLDRVSMLRIALLNSNFDIDDILLGLGKDSADHRKDSGRMRELIAPAAAEDLGPFVFHGVFGGELSPRGWEHSERDKGRDALRSLAKSVGVDAAAIERKFDKPEKPKTTAKPKAVKKSAAKKCTAKPGATKAQAKKTVKSRTLTPEARKRIEAAQKKRWAAKKGGSK